VPVGYSKESFISYGFSSFLVSGKEFTHDYLGIILIELGEEPGFQVNPRVNRAVRKTPKPVKGYATP